MEYKLSKYFTAIASKYLSAVEIDPEKSNQHELNGVNKLRLMFGLDMARFESVKFIYLGDGPEEIVQASGTMTWYDARLRHPTRTEYRLYYEGNEVMDLASPGDMLVIGLRPGNELIVAIARAGSSAEEQLSWLLETPEGGSYGVRTGTDRYEVGFVERHILSLLDVDTSVELPADALQAMIERFGEAFPTTDEFASYARDTLGHIAEDPDEAIIQCVEREEALFRLLESHIVSQRLAKGFSNMDEFEEFAKSWINRRYSRAGNSFEHHLKYVFERSGLSLSCRRVTEGNKKPDFVFPHISAYHHLPDEAVEELVTILGAKTSCKDRWRQVINEANRVKQKYLVTLEPGISQNQINEMKEEHLRLVVPESIHKTYTDEQQSWLMSLKDFVALVKSRQDSGWPTHYPADTMDQFIAKHSNKGKRKRK